MSTPVPHPLVNVSMSDLQSLGLDEIAYIKPTEQDGRELWAIHGADGSVLATADSEAVAAVVIRQNDMEPHWLQ